MSSNKLQMGKDFKTALTTPQNLKFLLLIALRYLKCQHRAKDCLQDMLLDMLSKREIIVTKLLERKQSNDRVVNATIILPYLKRAIKNKAIDSLRKNTRRIKLVPLNEADSLEQLEKVRFIEGESNEHAKKRLKALHELVDFDLTQNQRLVLNQYLAGVFKTNLIAKNTGLPHNRVSKVKAQVERIAKQLISSQSQIANYD